MTNDLHVHGANVAPLVTSQEPTGALARSFKGQHNKPGAPAERPACDHREKTVTTARARAALAGFMMHLIVNNGGQPQYQLTKWNLTREFADLAEVTAFLDQTGARDA